MLLEIILFVRACLTGREREVHRETVLHSTGEGSPDQNPGRPPSAEFWLSGLDFILPFGKWEGLQQHLWVSPPTPSPTLLLFLTLIWSQSGILSEVFGVSASPSPSVKPDVSHWVCRTVRSLSEGTFGKCLANDELSRNTCCWKYCGP